MFTLTVNRSSANGALERLNKTIKTMLTAIFDEQHDGTSNLHHLRNACMSQPHSALGNINPYEMLYGICPRYPLSNEHKILFCRSPVFFPTRVLMVLMTENVHLHNVAA
jgi:hypothetical protein